MLKRNFFAVAGIVMMAMWGGAAQADVPPSPGVDSGGTPVVAGVALIAIVAVLAIILLRRKR